MRKLLLFLLLACLSPAVVGKALNLPTDTINNHQIYLNKKPLLFANAIMKKEELKIQLDKKKLKSSDTLEVAYGSCALTSEKLLLSLQDMKGNTVWQTFMSMLENGKIPASVLLQSKEKEVSVYFDAIFLAKITIH